MQAALANDTMASGSSKRSSYAFSWRYSMIGAPTRSRRSFRVSSSQVRAPSRSWATNGAARSRSPSSASRPRAVESLSVERLATWRALSSAPDHCRTFQGHASRRAPRKLGALERADETLRHAVGLPIRVDAAPVLRRGDRFWLWAVRRAVSVRPALGLPRPDPRVQTGQHLSDPAPGASSLVGEGASPASWGCRGDRGSEKNPESEDEDPAAKRRISHDIPPLRPGHGDPAWVRSLRSADEFPA